MHCPFCRHPDSRVVDSRTTDDGTAIRRRRQCPHCSRRFTTVENASLMVIKRSGVTEPFSRDKVIAGVRKACQGRPVTEDALAQLGQRVEEAVRATGSAELSTHDVGLAILGPLRELDLVAYLRFASVYQAFDSLEDFEAAIAELRAARADARGDHDGDRDGSREDGAGEARERAVGGTPAGDTPAGADGRRNGVGGGGDGRDAGDIGGGGGDGGDGGPGAPAVRAARD
ncbi:transcriptional regulator NrdR [Streptomyces macrosporus]|uniref:Transcriptional repressor NrdR n=1 Tax=Streptomyces macrosporus TaxID=44032 RepID=A0ABP5X8S0_9ACTN